MLDLLEKGSDVYVLVIIVFKIKFGGKGKVNLKIDGLVIFKKDRLVDILKKEYMIVVLILLN